jgi:hypothetical protein
MAPVGGTLSISKKDVRQQIARSYVTALRGVTAQTSGVTKLAESRLRAALSGGGSRDGRARVEPARGIAHRCESQRRGRAS